MVLKSLQSQMRIQSTEYDCEIPAIETVHIVIKQPDENIPVYVVRPEDGGGKDRVLHRDMLLPCGFLPVVHNVPSHVSGTADEEQEVSEASSAVEAAEDRDLSTSREEEDSS